MNKVNDDIDNATLIATDNATRNATDNDNWNTSGIAITNVNWNVSYNITRVAIWSAIRQVLKNE